MDVFVEIGILVAIAAVISLIMRALRQPLIIGYIITGFLVGPYVFNIAHSAETMRIFAELGIALLLFIVGLNLSPKVFKEVGSISLWGGLIQVAATSLVGYGLVQLFGFDAMSSWYIALAFTFSSTIIVLKLLSDKGDTESLYGKISIGFLLLQDIIATLLLIFAASMGAQIQEGVSPAITILLLLGKGALLTTILIFISTKVLKKLTDFLGRSQELLFMFTIGWGIGIAALFYALGLSIEVGALIAGVALALSPFHHEMAAKMRPLRDFFIVIFFVFLGSQLSVANVSSVWIPALVLCVFVLLGKPLVVMTLMGIFGYRKRTGFFSGLTLAQISEFSLILIMLGVKNGQLNESALSLVTLVGVITIAASSYMILYADRLYKIAGKWLSLFERRKNREIDTIARTEEKETIVFGCNRTGLDLVETLQKEGRDVLVVDYDPEVIAYLRTKNINCIYGDVEDSDFLDDLRPWNARMVISTIPEFEGSELLIEKIRAKNKEVIVILTSHSVYEAEQLYALGASYVIMPHFLGATYAAEMVRRNKFAHDSFAFEKSKHITYLETKKIHDRRHMHAERFGM